MKGLIKPIPKANYRSKKKNIQGRDKSFKNSALVEIMHDGMAPLMEEKKK